MSTINRGTGDSKPLRFVLYENSAREPKIITGHTFNLELTDSEASVTNVSGTLYSGDAGVYFDIPSSVYNTAGTYTYALQDTDANSDVITADTGSIIYS